MNSIKKLKMINLRCDDKKKEVIHHECFYLVNMMPLMTYTE